VGKDGSLHLASLIIPLLSKTVVNASAPRAANQVKRIFAELGRKKSLELGLGITSSGNLWSRSYDIQYCVVVGFFFLKKESRQAYLKPMNF
jgi:hypothetical protein